MHENAKQVYAQAKRCFEETYALLVETKEYFERCNDMDELADVTYAMKQSEKFLKDLSSTLKKQRENLERIACLLWVKRNVADPIKTDYVTATPNLKTMASLPTKKGDPEGYAALLKWLGIREDVSEDDAVRPHWPGMVEYLTKLMEEGKPLPPGIDPGKTYPMYTLSHRKRKEILEDNVA